MESLRDKVAIIGMGCCKFGENWDKSAQDMIVEVAYEAYQDAGVEPKQIQAAWVGTIFTGMSGCILADTLKLDGIPISRVENQCPTPMDALRNACYAVAAKVFDVVLVVGVEKQKDSGYSGLPDIDTFYPIHPVIGKGGTAPGWFSLPAARYFAKYGASREHLAKIAVKNHKNGTLSPKAHFQKEITLEQALNAPIVSWPFGLFDCCPTTDGAAAAIITTKELAKSFNKDYVLVKALNLACDSLAPFQRPDFDFLGWPATQRAGQAAYKDAGVTNPAKQISMAEVHDCFTLTELLTYEDLGFCKKGEAKDHVDSGTFEIAGDLPVNVDGGLKSFGHPVGASGLRMIYEIYKQLQGKAGPRQLKKMELGLAHNIGGFPQVSSVAILGR